MNEVWTRERVKKSKVTELFIFLKWSKITLSKEVAVIFITIIIIIIIEAITAIALTMQQAPFLSVLILKINLCGGCYYCLHFTDEETETRRDKVTYSRPRTK